MQNIIIDQEFKSFLPMLNKETYESLEANILQNGCRDSLVLWGDILIDGHNRYAICTRHNIPFNTVQKEFGSREEVLIWIITTQMSRRNLTLAQLRYYRGKHYEAEKKIQGGSNRFTGEKQKGNSYLFEKKGNTAELLGKKYNVAGKTIRSDAKVAMAIDTIGETSPEAKRKILTSEANITKKALEELLNKPKQEIEAEAVKIENDAYENEKPIKPAPKDQGSAVSTILPGIQSLSKAISKLSDDINSNLPQITQQGSGTELKTALRACIDRLGELYKCLG